MRPCRTPTLASRLCWLLPLWLGACAAPKPDIAPGAAPALDTPQAGLRMVMERAERSLITSGQVVDDPALHDYLGDIACRLSPPYCGDIRIYVVRQPAFNASMAPNGFMVVWTGALLRMENEDQLATVIGHELAHYIRQHTLQRWEQAQATINVANVFGLAMAVVGVGPLGNLAAVAAMGQMAAHSREQEREADRLGFEMMREAGYDPDEAAEIWRGIVVERDAGDEDEPSIFLASHPPSRERLEALIAMARAEVESVGAAFAPQRDRFLMQILPHRRDWLEDEIDLGRFAQLDVLLDRLLAQDGGRGPLLYARGELLRRNDASGLDAAVTAYREALTHPDAPVETYRSLGLAYWAMERRREAQDAFADYLAGAPEAADRAMIEHYLSELRDRK